MGLRTTAEIDLGKILENIIYGFGWSIVLTDPSGFTKPLIGFSNDISQVIDPDTGEIVSGRLASVVLRISSVLAAGFATLPVGVADANVKPWIVVFDDINGNSFTFKIMRSNPDRTLGSVSCLLEQYKT